MSTWQSKTLAELLPPEVAGLVSSAGPIASTVATLTGNIATLAQTLSALVIDFIDPIEAATAAFIAEVDAFIEDLQNTGVYVLVVPAPRNERGRRGTEGFIRTVQDAMYDTSDPQRPPFNAGAVVGGVVILLGAPTLDGLKNAADSLGKVLNLKELRDLKRSIEEANPPHATTLTTNVKGKLGFQDIPVTSTEGFLPVNGAVKIDVEVITYESVTATAFKNALFTANHNAGTAVKPAALSYIGEAPDWRAKRVSELFPPIGVVLSQLDQFVQKIRAAVAASAAISAFANMLAAKATALSDLATALSDAVTSLLTDFNSTGINVLIIPDGVGGNARIVSEMQTSLNKPAFSEDAYTCGIVIMGGAGTTAVLETFFG